MVAKVITGNPFLAKEPDSKLREPPVVSASDPQVSHDSVQGKLAGSDVIILYSNKNAYPQYLITYR
jgi:hypothetical protein